MKTDLYEHMMRDIEKDCVDYIMGLWHMHKIAKMVSTCASANKSK